MGHFRAFAQLAANAASKLTLRHTQQEQVVYAGFRVRVVGGYITGFQHLHRKRKLRVEILGDPVGSPRWIAPSGSCAAATQQCPRHLVALGMAIYTGRLKLEEPAAL